MAKDTSRNMLMDELLGSDAINESVEMKSGTNKIKFTAKIRDEVLAVLRKNGIDTEDGNVNMIVSQFFDNLTRI
jgi:hypothetical protein